MIFPVARMFSGEGARRRAGQPSTIVIIVYCFFSAIYIVVNGIISPYVKDAMSPLARALAFVSAAYTICFISLIIASAVCLLRRRWIPSLCYFMAGLLTPASMYASLAIKGDRFTFTAGPHREIADIYHQRRSELERNVSDPGLIDIDDQCHPPNGCGCWIVVDLRHTSGVEREIGRWHRPSAAIFSMNTSPGPFEIVDVMQINNRAYSVLGCEADWTALKPL